MVRKLNLLPFYQNW